MQKIVASGINPKTKKISEKNNIEDENLTIGRFIDQWKTIKFKKLGFVDPNRRNSTQTQIERYLAKDILPALGRIPLKHITRQDVLQVLRKMERRGAFVPAEKCRSWLKEIFSHALVVGYIDFNPAIDMHVVAEPKPPVKNNPYLQMSEIPDLLAALEKVSADIQNYLAIKLLLLTGVRPGELRFAKPEHFNIDNALWKIPAQEVKQLQRQVKQGKEVPDYLVPLSTQALEIVKQLLSMCYTNQCYLLIGRTQPSKPISENTLNKVLHRIGYKGKLTTHGIRGTISTALYELEYDGKWIEAQLSHIDPNKTRRAYNHASYVEQRRQMMQDWADMLDKCIENHQQ